MHDFSEFENDVVASDEFVSKIHNIAAEIPDLSSADLSSDQKLIKFVFALHMNSLKINLEYLRAYHEWLSSQED